MSLVFLLLGYEEYWKKHIFRWSIDKSEKFKIGIPRSLLKQTHWFSIKRPLGLPWETRLFFYCKNAGSTISIPLSFPTFSSIPWEDFFFFYVKSPKGSHLSLHEKISKSEISPLASNLFWFVLINANDFEIDTLNEPIIRQYLMIGWEKQMDDCQSSAFSFQATTFLRQHQGFLSWIQILLLVFSSS